MHKQVHENGAILFAHVVTGPCEGRAPTSNNMTIISCLRFLQSPSWTKGDPKPKPWVGVLGDYIRFPANYSCFFKQEVATSTLKADPRDRNSDPSTEAATEEPE